MVCVDCRNNTQESRLVEGIGNQSSCDLRAEPAPPIRTKEKKAKLRIRLPEFLREKCVANIFIGRFLDDRPRGEFRIRIQ